jgi:hypothetical protein
MGEHARLAPMDQANLLAGHAVSYATAYLNGRHDIGQLADNADRLFLDLLVVETAETSRFLIPVQLLAIAMMRTAKHAREIAIDCNERSERWQAVMGSLIELVQAESRAWRDQKSNAETRR